MRVADRRHSRLQNTKKRRVLPLWAKITLISLGLLAAIFVLANLAMWVVYRGKVLPNYSVGTVAIGGVKFSELDQKVPEDKLLLPKVTFKKDSTAKEFAPTDLGVAIDWAATQENIKKSHSLLPLLSLVFKHKVPVELELDNSRFASAAKDLEAAFKKEPLPDRIVAENGDFVVAQPEDGHELDVIKLRQELVGLLELGEPQLEVPTKTIAAEGKTGKLQDELAALRKQLGANITFVSGDSKKQLSRADLTGLYGQSGQTLKLSGDKISQFVAGVVSEFGITAVNQSEAVTAVHYAVSKQQPVEFVLSGQGAQVYHYCVAARGLDASVLGEYRQKLAAVYADPRGWNNGGQAAFVYAESGCDFTAWLSSAAEVTSFSSYICDNFYSCRIGPNVIVNYDRWMGATPSWNDAGGQLEDYRAMVINHETGHWLGFGHRNCPGAGQPAPLMQQQSIDLQGCKFNAWPTPAELSSL